MAKPGPLLVRWEQHTLEKEISTPMMKAASTMPAAMQEHHRCVSCPGAPNKALLLDHLGTRMKSIETVAFLLLWEGSE